MSTARARCVLGAGKSAADVRPADQSQAATLLTVGSLQHVPIVQPGGALWKSRDLRLLQSSRDLRLPQPISALGSKQAWSDIRCDLGPSQVIPAEPNAPQV